MESLDIISEIYYQKEIYVVDSHSRVYVPNCLKSLVNPYKNNSINNFRDVSNDDLVNKILKVVEENGGN